MRLVLVSFSLISFFLPSFLFLFFLFYFDFDFDFFFFGGGGGGVLPRI